MRERAQSGLHVAARITGRRTRCAVHENLYQSGCLGCDVARGWRTSPERDAGADDEAVERDLFNGWPLP